jgi:hypothetical protein
MQLTDRLNNAYNEFQKNQNSGTQNTSVAGMKNNDSQNIETQISDVAREKSADRGLKKAATQDVTSPP